MGVARGERAKGVVVKCERRRRVSFSVEFVVGVGDERARGIELVGERGAWKRARCVSSEESRGDVGGARHDDVDE